MTTFSIQPKNVQTHSQPTPHAPELGAIIPWPI